MQTIQIQDSFMKQSSIMTKINLLRQ